MQSGFLATLWYYCRKPTVVPLLNFAMHFDISLEGSIAISGPGPESQTVTEKGDKQIYALRRGSGRKRSNRSDSGSATSKLK